MNTQRQERAMVIIGGASFIIGALAFVSVFSYLAVNFSYPAILEGSAAEVLPRLREGGTAMRAAWAVYAFLPLTLLPGAVGAVYAFPSSPARMRLALVFAAIAALSMCIGLMRWPSVHWALAEAYAGGAGESKSIVAATFDGLNLYFGNYIGEFLGETTLAAFFFLAGLSQLDESRYPRWLGWSGVAFALLFIIGAFRNVTSLVKVIVDINNGLLPLWLIILGASLIGSARRTGTE